MSTPLDPLRKLYKRIKEKAAENNLDVATWAVIPSEDEHGHDRAIVTFLMTPESMETAAETIQRKTDAEFEAMMGGLDLTEDILTDNEKAAKLSDKKALEEARQAFLNSQKKPLKGDE